MLARIGKAALALASGQIIVPSFTSAGIKSWEGRPWRWLQPQHLILTLCWYLLSLR